MFKIIFLFIFLLHPLKGNCQYSDSAGNKLIKPAIFFDDEIITNAEFAVYEIIVKFINQNPELTRAEVTKNIVTNFAKRKYVLKYITNINEADFLDSTKTYITSLSTGLPKTEQPILRALQQNPQHLKIFEKYIINELMWANALSNSIAPSIRVEGGEVRSFLKTHPNATEETAYQTLTQQKLDPLAQTILEQVKNFTYTKIEV